MLETFILDHIEGYKRPTSILSDCLLSAPYYSFSFLTWSGICHEAYKREARYRSGVVEVNLLGWRNCEFFMIPREECVKLYPKVPSLWRETNLVDACTYRSVHYFRVCRVRLWTTHSISRICIVLLAAISFSWSLWYFRSGSIRRMCLYRWVPLVMTRECSRIYTEAYCIRYHTRYCALHLNPEFQISLPRPVFSRLGHAAILRASEVNSSVENCPGW